MRSLADGLGCLSSRHWVTQGSPVWIGGSVLDTSHIVLEAVIVGNRNVIALDECNGLSLSDIEDAFSH